MAGSFGFEREHYDVSRDVGELALLPAVRAASAQAMLMADGFSCREQIAQLTDRRALHLAQVMRLALHQDTEQLPQTYPEQRVIRPLRAVSTPLTGTLAAVIGIGALAGGILLWKWHGRSRRDDSRHAVRRMPYGNIKRLRISPV
jgi:hypothetical protein